MGYGVFATQDIPKGTITWAMDCLDRVFKPDDIISLGLEYRDIIDKYTFRDNQGNFILCWDHGRFINHSFRSNCLTTAYDFELAIKDIKAGEELTDDYGYLNLDEPFECIPEKWSRRTKVTRQDILRLHKTWDKKLLDAFGYFNSVEQPLKKFVNKEVFGKCQGITEGTTKMDSILTCYYNGEDGLEALMGEAAV